jgi:hypothetical protein
MRWCLRVKLAENWSRFGSLLLATEDKPIVEESTRDAFWAAKPTTPGELVGVNALGRLLMELREMVRRGDHYHLRVVRPVDIKDFLFLGEPISTVNANARHARGDEPPQLHMSADWKYQL